jgi:phage tail-like protein
MRRSEIERLLPEVFQRTLTPGGPLGAVVDAMEALHAPCEAVLAEVDRTFSAWRAPDRFVPALARWVDLDRLVATGADGADAPGERRPSTSLGRLRELIATAAYLSQWRGTAHGLTLFLTTATGQSGFVIEEALAGPDGRPRPFHIRVRAPAGAAPHRALIERIVEQEKPVYVTWDLDFAPTD